VRFNSNSDHRKLCDIIGTVVCNAMSDLRDNDKIIDQLGDLRVKITPILADSNIEEDWNG
jgi:hypothetical protein